MVEITLSAGTRLNLDYDANGRVTGLSDNFGQRAQVEYDANGNVALSEISDADGTIAFQLKQIHDVRDRLLESRRPSAPNSESVIRFVYDGEGNLTGQIDPNEQITLFDYDAVDQLVRRTDAIDGVVSINYSSRGQIEQVITGNNSETRYSHDQLGRVLVEDSADRGISKMAYDKVNSLTALTDGRGVRREIAYDELTRVISVSFPEPNENTYYTYDSCANGVGHICQIEDESGRLEYEYDGFGNITQTTRTELSVEYVTRYEYDGEDRVTAIVYPSGRRVEYDRDILGRVIEVRAEVAGQMQPILTNIEYRADGELTAATFGNGLEETRTYDLQGRLIHQDLKDQSGLIADGRAYEYDPTGNITARIGTPGDQQYAYDALDRLIGQEISADGKSWRYDYGANHNRRIRTDSNLLEERYSYEPGTNRLIEIDKVLEKPGQRKPKRREFIYNQANRLAEYIEDGQTIARYTYNALGQRTRKELQTHTKVFHYDTDSHLLAETDRDGISQTDYLWLGDRPIAQIHSHESVTYFSTDHLRTPRIGHSDEKVIVWRWEGEVFGDSQPEGSVKVNLRLPGQYYDNETELHYNYFRTYDPKIGRYSRFDPVGLTGGINPYLYSEANPVSFMDPDGLRVRPPPPPPPRTPGYRRDLHEALENRNDPRLDHRNRGQPGIHCGLVFCRVDLPRIPDPNHKE